MLAVLPWVAEALLSNHWGLASLADTLVFRRSIFWALTIICEYWFMSLWSLGAVQASPADGASSVSDPGKETNIPISAPSRPTIANVSVWKSRVIQAVLRASGDNDTKAWPDWLGPAMCAKPDIAVLGGDTEGPALHPSTSNWRLLCLRRLNPLRTSQWRCQCSRGAGCKNPERCAITWEVVGYWLSSLWQFKSSATFEIMFRYLTNFVPAATSGW